jgi:tetratricopeptide (TPR) repeat protein
MKNILDFLSGNVPGGIGLYALVVAVIFLVLFAISRRNELFTPRHFKIWFGIVWLAITLVYAWRWRSDPPPHLLSRYSAMIYTSNESDPWLAYYFRDAISVHLKPYRGAYNYLYLQRWNYFAKADCAVSPGGKCLEIARKLPVDQIVFGEIKSQGGVYVIALFFKDGMSAEKEPLGEVRFSSASPGEALPQVLSRLGQRFPLREKAAPVSPGNKNFILAKDAFYRGEYPKSINLCRRVLQQRPDHPEILKWYYYNRIRLAKELRLKEKKTNPYDARKSSWQKMTEEARAYLINLFKTYYDRDINDTMLSNMIAESFILEELYTDAEEFLKIAYYENPFNIEVLQNLALLHDSRYKNLPFINDEEIFARVLDICPLHEDVLADYVEKLLKDVPVNNLPSLKIRQRVDRTLALNPASASAWILQGRYNLMTFDYPQAIRDFRKADSLEPNKAVVQYNLGVVYYKLKDYDTAEQYFRKAIQISDYLEAYLYLGALYKEKGEYEKALEMFRYRVARKQGDDDYYALQAVKGIRECLEALNIPIPQSQ